MQIFSFNQNKFIETKQWYQEQDKYFITCLKSEISDLQKTYQFDDITIEECTNNEDRIRFISFDNYDFITFVTFSLEEELELVEMNLFISNDYLILVFPSQEIENKFLHKNNLQRIIAHPNNSINRFYYTIFDIFITSINQTLDIFEDEVRNLEERLLSRANITEEYFKEINDFREIGYKITKYLRSLLYVGDNFVINDNNFIKKENMRYFRNLDMRINKAYDFSLTLKQLTDHLLNIYDSNLNAKTNDIVTKLTVYTLFFGPLTVITGIYGMNFSFMPELNTKYGYPLVVIIMFIISFTIYFVLKKKKWL